MGRFCIRLSMASFRVGMGSRNSRILRNHRRECFIARTSPFKRWHLWSNPVCFWIFVIRLGSCHTSFRKPYLGLLGIMAHLVSLLAHSATYANGFERDTSSNNNSRRNTMKTFKLVTGVEVEREFVVKGLSEVQHREIQNLGVTL